MNPIADRALPWITVKLSCHHSDWTGIEINYWLFCGAFRSYDLHKSEGRSFSLYVYLSASSWDFFVCNILRRIETALGKIKEGLVVYFTHFSVVYLHILVNFYVLNRSALLNFLDLSDKTCSCLCLAYLVHFAKTLQGHLVKNNSCSFWVEDFGLWNPWSGWRALWCQEQSTSFRVILPAFPLVFHFSAPLQRLVEVLQLLCLCSKAIDTASKNTLTLTYPLILSGSFSKGLCNVKCPRKQADKSMVWLLLM